MSEDPAHSFLESSGRPDEAGEIVRRIQAYLVQMRQRGDLLPDNKEEWDRFFRRHTPVFLKLVRSHHWPKEDWEDGVQELWLTLITRLPDLRYKPCRGQLRDWISAVARHRLADQDRYRKSHSMRRLATEAGEQLTGREPDPAAIAERNQLTELVREALAELRVQVSRHDYEAYTLRWLEGLSVREVASRLGASEAQVWASHHRMSVKLRPLLARRLNPARRAEQGE